MWTFLYYAGAGVGAFIGMRVVVHRGPPPMTIVFPGTFLGLVGLSNATHGAGDNLESLLFASFGALALGMVWQASITDWSEETAESDED